MAKFVQHIVFNTQYMYHVSNTISKEAFDKNKVQVMVCIDTEDWNINTSVNTPPLSLSKIRRPR